jgi:hypothetical protein
VVAVIIHAEPCCPGHRIARWRSGPSLISPARVANADVPMSAIASALYPPGFDHGWRAVTCVENHDLVLAGRDPRLPVLADPSSHRSWKERFNSDAYDHFENPQVAGNGSSVVAKGRGLHGFSASAGILIPANGVVVFARR